MHHTYEANLSKLVSLFCLLVALCASLSLADSDNQLYNGKVSLDNLNRLIATARALDLEPEVPADDLRRKRFRLGEAPANRRLDSNDDQEQFGLAGMKQDRFMGSQKKRADKLALKKRLHKMVEQMVENQYPADEQTGEQETKPALSAKHKKWQSSGDQDEKIMILVKKPSSYLDLATPPNHGTTDLQGAEGANLGGGALNLALRNYLNGQASSGPERERLGAGQQRPLVTVGEHERRVTNDGFGILRESVFTTNNHLGLKGVPKFGSDEEY